MNSLMKILMISTALALTACSDGIGSFSSSPSGATAQPAGKSGGYYKVGNPYQVDGIWYYPKEDYSYKEVGVSSWYGADFHNGITANGELYDMHDLTAAHRTLPLPSMVRVTNLQNGRSLVVRVNDRGPFKNDRIIDVSMKAAQILGFKDQGTTQVQVEVLPEESKALKRELLAEQEGQASAVDMRAPPVAALVAAENNKPAPPKNLNYPRLANKPPVPADEMPLIAGATAQTSDSDRYNDWDADLSQAQARREVVPPKPQSAPAPTPVVKKQPIAPAKKASVLTAAAIAPGYYVQVGAFGSEDNAEKMKSKVSKYGSVVIIPVTVNGKSLYRVRLGPANAKKALEIMDKVTNAGFGDARLVEEKASDVGRRLDRAF